jgi:hypothetical protein
VDDRPSHYPRFEALHRLQDEALRRAAETDPPAWSGDGIVMVAGGLKYFTNAWISISMLRRHGCSLPIQVWHLGPGELSDEMRRLLMRLDVELVDAHEVKKAQPMRILTGWECKPYAILHSPFRNVLFLDADNVPVHDPASLLATSEFARTGALFWHDIMTTDPDSAIWEMCRVPYQRGLEFESGQIVVDKERAWLPLNLAVHLNGWSDIYYQHVLGDKQTFHMAWLHLQQPFAMPAKRPLRAVAVQRAPGRSIPYIVAFDQHDFAGEVLFHHRVGAEWRLHGDNPIAGTQTDIQRECLELLAELRTSWNGRLRPDPPNRGATPGGETIARRYLLRRMAYDEREVEFDPGGAVHGPEGLRAWSWRLDRDKDRAAIVFVQDDFDLCRLTLEEDGCWRGQFRFHEQLHAELVPLP